MKRNPTTVAASYGTSQCLASGMTGHGINGCMAQATRYYPDFKGPHAKAAIYGTVYPTTEAAFEAMRQSGHCEFNRPLRETQLYFAGHLRRSWRKAVARGARPNLRDWIGYVIRNDFFLRHRETVPHFIKEAAHNAAPENLRYSNPKAFAHLRVA